VSRTFADIVAQKRILLCVGSGGVGKTTTAAAIAVEAARRGRRTLVLTIDPARRLADSLGLAELGHDVQQVSPDLIAASGAAPGGQLWAMMLDQQRAFDEIVARHAPTPEAMRRVLANPVYGQISRSLAGSQEYAALAKLQEFDAEGRWDLIVVDTPPTAHALDFLDAPQKLTSAIASPAVDWFRKLRQPGGGGWSLIGRTGSYVLKRLQKFVGSQFLDDLAVFFTEIEEVLAGFRTRADQVVTLLRRPQVGFVLVSNPEPLSIEETLFFHQRLTTTAMPFAAFVVNKVHTDLPATADRRALAAAAAALPEIATLALPDADLAAALDRLAANHAGIQALAGADAAELERLRQAGGPESPVLSVPYFREDVHDIGGLARIAGILFR
jgi:anion-transporting  ArsA/GET3 family ATPase